MYFSTFAKTEVSVTKILVSYEYKVNHIECPNGTYNVIMMTSNNMISVRVSVSHMK